MIIENPFELTEHIELETSDYYLYFLWYDNDLLYIGQTRQLLNRLSAHKSTLENIYNKITYKLYANITKNEIKKIERANINHYKPIFNDTKTSIYFNKDFCYVKGNRGGKFKINEFYEIEYDFRLNEKYYYYYNECILYKAVFIDGVFYFYENDKLLNTITEKGNVRIGIENNKMIYTFKQRNEALTT